MTSTRQMSKAKVWWQAFRYHYVSSSIFPAVLGGLVSWATNAGFIPLYFLLVLLALITNHIGLNMIDDYFDYKHSVDKLESDQKNPYTGGSGTLSSGLISPKSMFKAFTLCYIVTIAVGIYLTLTRGLPILAFGLFGVFCAIFYTAPPISFSYHGLGELAMVLNFGTIIGLGAFYVQAHTLTLQVFIATLPLGIMIFSLMAINEIPDVAEDLAAGKLTLVARYGKKAGAKFYVAGWICTYVVIISSVAFRILPFYTLFALLSLPIVYRSIRILRLNIDNPQKMAPANLDNIRAQNITALGLIAGYAIQGLLNKADAFQLLFILLLLAILYAPVARVLLNTKKKT